MPNSFLSETFWRAQRDAFALGFQLESIARSKLQPVPKTLGKNHSPCFVECDFADHAAIMTLLNGILA
jgi:hypothetical protein